MKYLEQENIYLLLLRSNKLFVQRLGPGFLELGKMAF